MRPSHVEHIFCRSFMDPQTQGQLHLCTALPKFPSFFFFNLTCPCPKENQRRDGCRLIPETGTNLEFGCVGFAANFFSSLAPCARKIVARSRKKIYAAALPNSKFVTVSDIAKNRARAGAIGIMTYKMGREDMVLFRTLM
jgi:hypothetical protein